MRRILRLYRAAFSGLPRDVWMLSFASLVNRAGTMVLPFVALYLTQRQGLSVSRAGLMLSVYGIGSIAGSYLGGWLSDRIGTIRTLQLSLVGAGVGFLVLSEVSGAAAITAVMFVLGVVAEAFRPATMAAMAERAPSEIQVRAFALLRMAVNVGMTIGPAVGGFLALYSYRWLFIADALTCWLSAVVLAAALSPVTPHRQTDKRAEEARADSPWRDRPFLLFMLVAFGMAVAFFQLFGTVPLTYRDSYGFRENVIGGILALNAALIVAFEMILVHWAERHDRIPIIALGTFLVCVGFGILPLGSSLGFAILGMLVWTLGEMLALPLMNVVVADRAGPATRGRYMGIYMMVFSAAYVVAPFGGTLVYERLGSGPLWLGVGLLGIPLALGTLALRPVIIHDRPPVGR